MPNLNKLEIPTKNGNKLVFFYNSSDNILVVTLKDENEKGGIELFRIWDLKI